MASLKSVLAKQTSIPAGIEAGLPAGAPKVSTLLTQVAANLPIDIPFPDLPIPTGAFPTATGGTVIAPPNFSKGFSDIVRGVEEAVPILPKMPAMATQAMGAMRASGVAGGGYREVEDPTFAKPTTGPVLGGGYRSI